MNERDLDFASPEELARMLEILGLALHSKNRIAGGESVLLWHLAETIRKVGRLAEQSNDEKLRAQYGDGYGSGKIPKERQEEEFLKLLSLQKVN